MIKWLTKLFIPTEKVELDLENVPDYEEYIDGLKYSTKNAILLMYWLKDEMYLESLSGDKKLANGLFFHGIYETINKRYFGYHYWQCYNRNKSSQFIETHYNFKDGMEDISKLWYESNYIKIKKPQKLIKYEEA